MCKTIYFDKYGELIGEANSGEDIVRIAGFTPKMTDDMPLNACLCWLDESSIPFDVGGAEYVGDDFVVYLDKPKELGDGKM